MKKLNQEIVFLTDDWNKEATFSLKRNDIEGNSKKIALIILSELKKNKQTSNNVY